jgi:signal transduction histidine kinase
VHDACVQNPDNFHPAQDRDVERVSRLIVAGELVTAVAHDLRQPVTATEMNVSAALRLLTSCIDEPSSPKTKSAFAEIGAALNDALVEQSRMRVALQVLEDLVRHREPLFASVDVAAIVHEVRQLVTSEISARHIMVELNVPSPGPSIVADGTLVRQALLNILINALESTSASHHPAGPIRIAVQSGDADAVTIVVTHFGSENGSEDSADHALALARSVASVHGASLGIEGNPESGIAIITRWPVRRPAQPTAN